MCVWTQFKVNGGGWVQGVTKIITTFFFTFVPKNKKYVNLFNKEFGLFIMLRKLRVKKYNNKSKLKGGKSL